MAIINQSDYPHTIVVSASDERRGWVPKELTDHCATELRLNDIDRDKIS